MKGGYWRISSDSEQEARSMDDCETPKAATLGRSASLSSSSPSAAFRMKRVFSVSMRRSWSVSERYCRMPNEEDEMEGTRSERQEGGVKKKILKACKRFLRFSSSSS
ncbi:unnamed protein product [Sphenostylis stenocarpa]|uniref:Uncharacterized protein n=1 Tax=Sphenostylis stenocarpa TaxID=92480 RepID=A0AA86VSQ4_9FABA|nr:unnamed protein product [Sphenostylis stenocarpa]